MELLQLLNIVILEGLMEPAMFWLVNYSIFLVKGQWHMLTYRVTQNLKKTLKY